MSVENLDKIFHPKSIAVVGASERKGSVGEALKHNLIERGFTGEIYPINPNHKKIWKLPACPSIRDLEIPVDLAVISTPIMFVPQIIKDCVDVGVGSVTRRTKSESLTEAITGHDVPGGASIIASFSDLSCERTVLIKGGDMASPTFNLP